MKTRSKSSFAAAVLVAAIGLGGGSAVAGPFIIAGTDADDHGSVNASGNQDGWFFMQRALENLGPGVTNGNNTVVFLGSDPSSTAGNAAQSAFNLSSLASQGWTSSFVNGAAAISTYLSAGLPATGILMLDSGSGNVGGGITGAEDAAVTAGANQINNFLGGGGGLFTQANDLGFLGVLLPGIMQLTFQDQGVSLTPAGQAAFPGLTNADLSAGPYHKQFQNFGSVPVLATESSARALAVILGASAGTITDPNGPGQGPVAVPEPASIGLFLLGLAGLGAARRRKG